MAPPNCHGDEQTCMNTCTQAFNMCMGKPGMGHDPKCSQDYNTCKAACETSCETCVDCPTENGDCTLF
jgi:hypothetical protein